MSDTSPVAPPQPTITECLADHIVGLRFDDIPITVVDKAKYHLAHHLGAALRGSGRTNGQQAVRIARELSGADGACSIIGDRAKASLLDAVFANAFLMHCAGLDDFLLPPGSNPGVITNPVAWAFAERSGATGRDLLTAIIVGYDVMAVLSDPALTFGLDDYRPAKHVIAPLGAAATAARLLGLSREQTAHALGHAGQVGRSAVGAGDHGWATHPLLARNGAMAAVLAWGGLTAPVTVLEGEHGLYRTFFSQDVPESVLAGLATLGEEYAVARAQVKRQPVSALNELPIELTRQLRERHALAMSRITAVDLAIPDERRSRETKRDSNLRSSAADRTIRMGSPRFLVASMLVDGHLDPARVERPPDADLLSVLEKVQMRFEPGHPLLYARVQITTIDGEQYAAEGDTLAAEPDDWAEWLVEGGRTILPTSRLAHLANLIRNLEDVRDVSEVMSCLVPGTA